MAFFRFRKAKESGSGKDDPAGGRAARPETYVQDMRARARHRLIGAVALVALAVIVFPLLFDTEQRPTVIDVPVVIAGAGDTAAVESPVTTAAADADTRAAGVPAPVASEGMEEEAAGGAEAPVDGVEGRDGDEAAGAVDWALGAPVAPPADTETVDTAQEPSATRSKVRVVPTPETARAAGTPDPASARAAAGGTGSDARDGRADRGGDAEARRALAALEGRTASPPVERSARFVVQVGAFSQDEQVRNVQRQIADIGLKPYTEVVQTGAGPRTRVRVGPYDNRETAERALSTLQNGGLPGQVLPL